MLFQLLLYYWKNCTVAYLPYSCPTAKEAFEKGNNPIIIDNTNMQGWEMKPYVAQVSHLISKLKRQHCKCAKAFKTVFLLTICVFRHAVQFSPEAN